MAIYRKSFKFLLLLMVLVGLVTPSILFIHWQKPLPVKPTDPTISVQTTTVTTRAVPIVLKFSGLLEAIKSVTINPQVNGIIKKINFQPGAMVSKNQLLFEIDSAPSNATLKQTKSNLKRDRAQLAQTQKEIEQYRMQMMQNSYAPIPRSRQNKVPIQGATATATVQQQYERAKGLANIQTATIEADKAQVRQAEIQLGYTRIHSPIAGKAGNITKKVGDLAAINNPMPLVVINQLDSLWVNFNLPQNKLTSLLTYQKKKNLQVNIFSEDNTQLLGSGELKFIDNMVDPQTGAVLLKAQIANPKQLLWPGLKVAVELVLTTEPQALVIPINAVQLDAQGQFVYVIENDKTKIRRIKIDREIENFAVIKEGLKNNETIITNVPPNLSENIPVRILNVNQSSENLIYSKSLACLLVHNAAYDRQKREIAFVQVENSIEKKILNTNEFLASNNEGRRGGITRQGPSRAACEHEGGA